MGNSRLFFQIRVCRGTRTGILYICRILFCLPPALYLPFSTLFFPLLSFFSISPSLSLIHRAIDATLLSNSHTCWRISRYREPAHPLSLDSLVNLLILLHKKHSFVYISDIHPALLAKNNWRCASFVYVTPTKKIQIGGFFFCGVSREILKSWL